MGVEWLKRFARSRLVRELNTLYLSLLGEMGIKLFGLFKKRDFIGGTQLIHSTRNGLLAGLALR